MMFGRQHAATAIVLACTLLVVSPAAAIDGEVLITHAKALAGNVTAGDAPDYPVTLTAPGSYKLSSNLSPGPGLDGIVVTAPDVTINLNGRRISGGPAGGPNNARFGIWGQGDRLTIKNGTIGGFTTAGISAAGRHYLIVEDLRVINSGSGINNIQGSYSRMVNITVGTNVRSGVYCGICHIEGSVISGNGDYGINMASGTVLGNTIAGNGKFGILTSGERVRTGFGNNTIVSNNAGGAQTSGLLGRLHPNFCAPTAC
jgi:hypothetical protein